MTARLRRWGSIGLAALVFAGIGFAVLVANWRITARNGGQGPAEPFRIAGDLYYVGANDVTAFMIAGPQGHILIDGGFPGTARMIMASIAKLGFDIKDVKVIVNTEPDFSRAGGIAELQKVSGAQVWAIDTSAGSLANGGAAPDGNWSPANFFAWAGVQKFEAPRVDRRFKDNEKLRLGTIELTPVHTPGQGGSCTTLSFSVSDGERLLRVVDVCNLKLGDPLAPLLPIIKRLSPRTYARIRSDFEHSFKVLKSLPVDIWVTSHARDFGRYRKFVASAKAKNPADAFIDPAGYLDYLDKAEMRFRELFAESRQAPNP